ncbi:hypothetical protein [Micromonospora sp. HUAS LYJ1]|uniref:RCC1 domain-containing protein n=1 Tax=Micromonospora sp. HUAS LYJ1 TaxID=3061626 RepID=UPI002672E308|nr:hypothetical protein [Micromonospora sp. HUAS LYJ1]WKU05551.1 hypothetical protein Q2K16_00315 [Micromonospora sp. HUAS LYJ1]WKU07165.1 hypothetical protein Q2K16_09005 [Micromonospora sp. HUAS LYJ1]
MGHKEPAERADDSAAITYAIPGFYSEPYVVPAGVDVVSLSVAGGGGWGGGGYPGGRGGLVEGDFPVVAGDLLFVFVGARPEGPSGGIGGGGGGGPTGNGGGGASAVYKTPAGGGPDVLLAVAGGGGARGNGVGSAPPGAGGNGGPAGGSGTGGSYPGHGGSADGAGGRSGAAGPAGGGGGTGAGGGGGGAGGGYRSNPGGAVGHGGGGSYGGRPGGDSGTGTGAGGAGAWPGGVGGGTGGAGGDSTVEGGGGGGGFTTPGGLAVFGGGGGASDYLGTGAGGGGGGYGGGAGGGAYGSSGGGGSNFVAVDAQNVVNSTALALAGGSVMLTPQLKVTSEPAFGWGFNASGQVGNGTHTNQSSPADIALPAGVILDSIEAGYSHSIAVDQNGVVYTWGDNAYGQLGTGDTVQHDTAQAVTLPGGVKAVAVAGGQWHSIALTATGEVYAWGRNNSGQLGTGDAISHLTPVKATVPAGVVVTAIATHNAHNIAVDENGDLYLWGDNTYGQIGIGTTTVQRSPVKVTLPAGDRAQAVAAGAFHSLAMTTTGTAYGAGYNAYGQLGNASNTNSTVFVPVSLGSAKIRDIDAGLSHSLAVTANGTVLTWGAGTAGQLGNGGGSNSNTPVIVRLPAGVTIEGLGAGQSHSLAVINTSTDPNYLPGQILAWGLNNYGQLGDGTLTVRTTPVKTNQIPGTIAVEVTGGQFHSLARFAAI